MSPSSLRRSTAASTLWCVGLGDLEQGLQACHQMSSSLRAAGVCVCGTGSSWSILQLLLAVALFSAPRHAPPAPPRCLTRWTAPPTSTAACRVRHRGRAHCIML